MLTYSTGHGTIPLWVTLKVTFFMKISEMLCKKKMVAGESSSHGERAEPVSSKGWRDSSTIEEEMTNQA